MTEERETRRETIERMERNWQGLLEGLLLRREWEGLAWEAMEMLAEPTD